MKQLFPVSRRRLQACTTRLQHAEDRLRVLETVFTHAPPVMVTDARARIQRVNAALCLMMGYSEEEMLDQTPRMFRSNHHDQAFYDQMVATIQRTGHWEGEVWDRRKSGDVFPKWMSIHAVSDERGSTTHMIACYTDLSGQQHAREQIHRLAFYDPLTQLPNRALLREQLQQALGTSRHNHHHGALLTLDWDDFKAFNDGLGYPQGDHFLTIIGQRIKDCLPEGDVVARLGGDEFAIILHALGAGREQAASEAKSVATRILAALAAPYRVDGLDYQGSASLGIVTLAADSPDVDSLLKQAEMAMYEAKKRGRGQLQFFDPALEHSATERLQLERELRLAIGDDQLILHYQPQLLHTDAGNFALIGAEALIRWQHPERGLLGPGHFIPLAEQTGLIAELGNWVLQQACARLSQWRTHPQLSQLVLAVNVSASQFIHSHFVASTTELLQHYDIPPARLKLELTESLLVDQPELVIETMSRLGELGIRFSLDDFGTGYSSLSYLKQLPLHQLKIDQSFVRDLGSNADDATISASVVGLAHGLGLEVIAEGVETAQQQQLLQKMGCQRYQGYWFSRPLPLAEFERWCDGPISPLPAHDAPST